MRFRLILIFSCMLITHYGMATHYRAGEIIYRVVSGRTYEVEINTYTDPSDGSIDKGTENIAVDWGDGSATSILPRIARVKYSGNLAKNIYIGQHTYATDKSYMISILDRNRIEGILNLNGGELTKNLAFSVHSAVKLNPLIKNNSSPRMYAPPIQEGCKGFLYIHNPCAYDPDGDSLTYELVPPEIAPGEPAPNYINPMSSDSFDLNRFTGQVTWASPTKTGYYNIAIRITEWRKTQPGATPIIVGQITRDMQINIVDCNNHPPVLDTIESGCIMVGDTLRRIVSAKDPDSPQVIVIQGISRPFSFFPNNATLGNSDTLNDKTNSVMGVLKWIPWCYNVRYDPMHFNLLVHDYYTLNGVNHNLYDYKGFKVTVIAPPLRNPALKQLTNSSLDLNWSPDSCGLATYYEVYRRFDSSHWEPDYCTRGIPSYTGFLKIASKSAIGNPNDTIYRDDELGKGLSPFIRYCYRTVAIYPARNESGLIVGGINSESKASREVCGVIVRSKPVITHASVNTTHTSLGSVQLSWLRPDTLDTTVYSPPYRLLFQRSSNSGTFTTFDSASYTTFASIPDGSLIDTLLNTVTNQYTYRIALMAKIGGTETEVDASPTASSIFTGVYSTDNANLLTWGYQVPWFNDSFVVYRKNQLGFWDEIGRTNKPAFADTGLINGIPYTYKILGYGRYPLYPLVLENYSQEITGTPVDTVPPCQPPLVITPPCSDYTHYENVLTWSKNGTCDTDVVNYNVYYKLLETDEFVKIATLPGNVFTYVDNRDILKKSIAGCYTVTGVDSFNNESPMNTDACIDNCPEYLLPNVFTPNGDNLNDLFHPFKYRFINSINIIILNRWGEQVFHTEDLDINWNGRDERSGKEVSDGVYFYICEINEQYLQGLRKRVLRGTVQIIR